MNSKIATPEVNAPIDRMAMERSIELAFAFARVVFADPTIMDQIPDGASVALIPDDDPELAARDPKPA